MHSFWKKCVNTHFWVLWAKNAKFHFQILVEKAKTSFFTHFFIFQYQKTILLNPISRLSRICACFTSTFNVVRVSIDHFDTFYPWNAILLYLIPFNPISRLSRICACLTSLINLVWASITLTLSIHFYNLTLYIQEIRFLYLIPLIHFNPISRLSRICDT